MAISGSCLCGALRFEVEPPFLDISRCHCSRCRKVSGTDGNAALFLPLPQFRWLEEPATLRSYQTDYDWQTNFCGRCGCPAPSEREDANMAYVPAGILDGDPGVPVGVHIFVGSKASWDLIAGDAPQYEESWT